MSTRIFPEDMADDVGGGRSGGTVGQQPSSSSFYQSSFSRPNGTATTASSGQTQVQSGGNSDGFYQSSFTRPSGNAPNGAGGSGGGGSVSGGNNDNSQYYMPPPPVGNTAFDGTIEYDEPPLLEELGINIPAVIAKARAVANPFSRVQSSFADDADMTGPVILCLMLGFLLLLQGKVQFGVIYGQATIGCIAMYMVFNLMSNRGIDLYRSTSILGYSLMPMVVLSLFAVFLQFKKHRLFGALLGGGCILWSTTTAAKIFVAVLAVQDQFWLLFYPLALLYTSFAFITVF